VTPERPGCLYSALWGNRPEWHLYFGPGFSMRYRGSTPHMDSILLLPGGEWGTYMHCTIPHWCPMDGPGSVLPKAGAGWKAWGQRAPLMGFAGRSGVCKGKERKLPWKIRQGRSVTAPGVYIFPVTGLWMAVAVRGALPGLELGHSGERDTGCLGSLPAHGPPTGSWALETGCIPVGPVGV
jgi:hypothetical protein